jgi:hypothetical protein
MKKATFDRCRNLALASVLMGTSSFVSNGRAAGSADLWQARNGSPDAPIAQAEWVKGNAGPANSHYVEGHSIPYRIVVSDANLGSHTLVLEWDTTQKGKHAIDYIAHFDRLLPHSQFGSHTQPETINPIVGFAGPFAAPQTFPIPAPSSSSSPVADQPTASFNSLPAGERALTIWNGTIANVAYVRQDSAGQDSGVTQLSIEFVADAPTVVIAFGGHIASKADWGIGNSASSIGGSPYHMRMVSFDGGGGNQDRSVQALAVLSPVSCSLSGPVSVCAKTTNTYSAATDAGAGADYAWSLPNNNSGASIVGPADGPAVQVQSGSGGAYTVQVLVSSGGASSHCSQETIVNAGTSATPLTDQTVCLGNTVTFSTTASGTGPFTFLWRKDNVILAEATNQSLTIAPVTSTDAGRYCVEVMGACGSVTRCATLAVESLPVIICPPDFAVQCVADVPPPQPASISLSGGSGIVTVTHVRDVGVTNGCEIVIARAYKATDTCGLEATCTHLITVRDTIAPILTCAPDRTVECGVEWMFDPPTSTDNCDGLNAAISVVSTVTNAQCGNTFTATRTWQATDACGNTSRCSQTVTIVDTTAPALTCAGNRNIECGAVWDFDPPSAADICGDAQVAVEVTSTVTNQLVGALFAATRAWLATDPCGNQATCIQTLTLVDTTPPALTCPSDILVPCSSAAGATVSFTALATDTCDQNPQITFNPPSGSIFALGTTRVTCVATDVSGNRSECSFMVRVQDSEPPQILCPSNITILENAAGSGTVSVNYPAPIATDNCDDAPSIVCVPPSGSPFSSGDTTVTCTATDTSGNQVSCTFTIRVVPETIIASSTADSGPGTLRQALLDANAAVGPNKIDFAFLSAPPYVINLLSPLPEIVDAVIIDGWSQLEFRGDPVVQLDGSNAIAPGEPGGVAGLVVTTGNTTVRGLVLNGFAVGIRVQGPGSNVIQGNFIGTDLTGGALSNSADGIYITSPNNLIGGSTLDARNIVSANRGRGIVLDTPEATGNIIEGNFIGTASDGVTPLGNGLDGVVVRNGAANNFIGPHNLIAHNGGNGVLIEITAGPGNGVRENIIMSNGGLSIDIGGDGVSPNDNGDEDSGPNDYQNKPTIFSARTDGVTTTIRGTLNSAASSSYSIELFVQTPSLGFASQSFLGAVTLTTDRDGNGEFETTLASFIPAGNLITATATDGFNNTSEFSTPVTVGSIPILLVQPVGTNVPPGSFVMFCVVASGTEPLSYQWRKNGANIPAATNECFTIASVDLADGGTYTVVVANELGAVISDPALLRLDLPKLAVGDNFADRVTLIRTNGVASGTNLFATREAGEPLHSGKPGGSSVWYTWTAPADGIATFATTGSTFDTLLAVYSGSTLGGLIPVDVDEDGGGFYTSGTLFNASAGTSYQIAVDGYGGASGYFVLSWSLELTSDALPVITNQPVSKTVSSGANVTFVVGAFAVCRDNDHDCRDRDRDGHPDHPGPHLLNLSYQWFFNGLAIKGATMATLTVTNVQDSNVGIYTVQVSNGGRTLLSDPAILQINETGAEVQNVQALDKFFDSLTSNPLRLGEGAGEPAGGNGGFQTASTVVRGYTGTQVFNTAGSATETGEEPICGVVGGASEWISFVAEETGSVYLNTDGSSYDTVIAIFTRMTNSPMLQLLGCDNNSGLDGQDSALVVPVQAGRTNFIVVDGVNGVSGVLRLNYSLVTPTLLTAMGTTLEGAARVRLAGRPGLRFTIQRSTDLQTWSSLVTTNAASGVFDLIDPGPGVPGRFYRALVLP